MRALSAVAVCLVLLAGPMARASQCTLDKPCDGIREWAKRQVKNASLHCAPDQSAKCQELEALIERAEEEDRKFWTGFCVNATTHFLTSKMVYPYVGQPDQDETKTCGAKTGKPYECRMWTWTWSVGVEAQAFVVLFERSGDEWVAQKCLHCPNGRCREIPFQP
ncbi:MAG TPA: hypothetical protein VMH40_20085 [Myxococcaceae bacterium]|nr:hypothetical protein [Myxococcaceae bacterium]